ncbi:MAG TPA: helix-turn-helix domain-containing protein [Stellaceae bacterium]|jgi:AcrR family transcriptional regulator|nr:helix-turn-helix domain-containing protein [Stellaceae bacterium]
MAKRQSPRVSGGAATAPVGSDRDRMIDALLRLIPQQGWRRLSMAAIAAEADLPILDLYRAFSSKPAILRAFFRRIDETVLATPLEAEADERPRDRVFDILMRRFDALNPYREALDVLGRELRGDPLTALGAGAGLLHSIAWMLEAAGVSTTGLFGIAAVKLTTAAYLATLRNWFRDDSPDLATTMATLDRRLRGIERWFGASRHVPQDDAESRA